MYLLYRFARRWTSLLGISVAGAMTSNLAQLQLSRIILFGDAARLIAPPFLIAGLATSIVLGLFAIRFVESSTWYASRLAERSL